MKNIITICATVMCVAVAFSQQSSQVRETKDILLLHHEVPDDDFVPAPQRNAGFSPAYRIATRGFFAVQVNVDDSSRNILGDAANEPTIAVDPTNPNRMAIGWRQFNSVTSNFRQAGYGYTTDGGNTWRFPGVIQPGIFRSDPVLDADADGNFYYNSLTSAGSNFMCDVFISTSGGASWGTGTPAKGGDKQWMTIDRTAGIGEGNIYSFWTNVYSICPPGFFTRSRNRGLSYDDCDTIPEEPFWGTLAVGLNGELFVCGRSGTSFVMARSSTARDTSQEVLWDLVRPVSLDGVLAAFSGSSSPNPGGLHGQAWVAVDHSTGPTRGNVYVLASVQRNSISDPLDVMFARSTDGGDTWSPPIRVNDDASTSAWQWFGTMSVAPTGRIDVVWLDTRDNPGSVNSSLYYSGSMDGGVTWSANVRLSAAFNPHIGWPQQNKMGDYFHMLSDSAAAHLAWAGTFNGEQDVYYGRITFPLVPVEEQPDLIPVRVALSQNYPNPFNPTTVISFQSPVSSLVSIRIFDVLGREVATLVNEEKPPGKYNVTWDASNMPSGVYLYRLTAGASVLARKMIVVK